MRNLFVALFTLISGPVLAQDAQPQQSATPEAEKPATETPPPAAETPPSTPAQSIDERMITAEGRVAALEELENAAQVDLSALKKLKFSGYIQARYQYQEADEHDDQRFGDGFSRFSIRRSRLKAVYTGEVAQYLLQINAIPEGVTVTDAEATLFIPGTRQSMSLTMGAMKWPFGYEVVQSSVDREMPERSRVVRNLLPGERDIGVKFNARLGALRFNAGVFNGSSLATPIDPDKEKDIVGHLGFDLKWLSGGVSGWYGDALGKRTTGPDPDTYRHAYTRYRVGADVQAYFDVLPVGATALKGEYIVGKTYGGSNNAGNLGTPASGWYVLLVQNLGLENVVAVRFDHFDPNHGIGARADANPLRPAGTNSVDTLDLLASHYFGENLKVSAVYELPMTATVDDVEDPKDNLFTLQMQARF